MSTTKRTTTTTKPKPQIMRLIPRQISRRTMLRGALGAGISLPLLELMRPRSTRAQAASPPPKRFGIMFSPCGTIPENWRSIRNDIDPSTGLPSTAATPSGGVTDYTLSPILQPLVPFQKDINVIRGVNMESANSPKYGLMANVHDQGMTHMLTGIGLKKGPAGAGRANHFLDGSAGGPSIDQHIAQAIGQTTLLPSLELGVESTDTFLEVLVTRMCYGNVDPNDSYGRAIPVPPVDDPVQIYTRLFGTDQTGSPEQVLQSLQNKQSVLDYVASDYADLKARVGKDDSAKLDQHLTNIRDIETRLGKLIQNPAINSCPSVGTVMPVSPARQQCLRDQDLRTPAELAMQAPNFCVTNFQQIGTLQMDLMILALTCDLTRVATMQWSTAESTVIHTWLPLRYQGTREHHMMTHNETVAVSASAAKVDQATATTIRGDLTLIHNWYAQQYAYMLGKLKAVDEGDGTSLLDNMLFFWTNELGIGGTHSYTNVPYVIAGSCGGQMPTGRYIDYIGDATPGFGTGQAHNKLFVSFLKMLGIDENTFGLPDFSGPLPGLVPGQV
jgi:hypothetical protein